MKRSLIILLSALLGLASCGTTAQYASREQQFPDGIYYRPQPVVEMYTEEDFRQMAARNIAAADTSRRKQQNLAEAAPDYYDYWYSPYYYSPYYYLGRSLVRPLLGSLVGRRLSALLLPLFLQALFLLCGQPRLFLSRQLPHRRQQLPQGRSSRRLGNRHYCRRQHHQALFRHVRIPQRRSGDHYSACAQVGLFFGIPPFGQLFRVASRHAHQL